MSDTLTSLLAALVGAIVGGAASLIGTMIVNKQQMATNARVRLYDELLPNLALRVDGLLDDWEPASAVAEEQMPDLLEAVRRASAIAGPFERKAAHNLASLWVEHRSAPRAEMPTHLPESVSADPPDPPGKEPTPSPAERRLRKMQEEIRALSDHLGATLG
jgi:hypothetical protein